MRASRPIMRWKKVITFLVRVDVPLSQDFVDVAEKQGLSLSEAMRQAMREYVRGRMVTK